jgi:hypothetical protein
MARGLGLGLLFPDRLTATAGCVSHAWRSDRGPACADRAQQRRKLAVGHVEACVDVARSALQRCTLRSDRKSVGRDGMGGMVSNGIVSHGSVPARGASAGPFSPGFGLQAKPGCIATTALASAAVWDRAKSRQFSRGQAPLDAYPAATSATTGRPTNPPTSSWQSFPRCHRCMRRASVADASAGLSQVVLRLCRYCQP